MKITKGLGWASGIYGVYDAWGNYRTNPSLYNATKLGLSAVSLTNPWVGLGLGTLDVTGTTDWILTTATGK